MLLSIPAATTSNATLFSNASFPASSWHKPFVISEHHPPRPIPRIHSTLHPVSLPPKPRSEDEEEDLSPSSVAAVAAAIRRASPASPVEFSKRVEKPGEGGRDVMPSPDFQRLCLEQLHLFRAVVHRSAVLSVFVRPAGSYVMDQLELTRIAFSAGIDVSDNKDCVVLIGNFAIPAGLHAAEAVLSQQQVEYIREHEALVLPMVKHPFILGFLVAELPNMEMETSTKQTDKEHLPLPSCPHFSNKRMWEVQGFKEDLLKIDGPLTNEQRSMAIAISSSLAVAYVMDQKAILLQQSSWQNNIRMSNLVEQIRISLSSIRALGKMLSVQVKRSEISQDIIEDILLQGDHISDALQQLQDAVYLTKANILRYNDETSRRCNDSVHGHSRSFGSVLSYHTSVETQNYSSEEMESLPPPDSGRRDIEMPMPPHLLAPLQHHNIRPCLVSDVLTALVGAAVPLANKQRRSLEFRELSKELQVAVEESALRQAMSNLIEGALLRSHVGGTVQIYAAGAPAGGALIVIDDDGPDMHYMTQMHSLAPFGADLFSDGMIEDNMTWNFVAGLTVAREILESYGCVVRVISPRTPDSALGTGGTRVELWLPALQSDTATAQEA